MKKRFYVTAAAAILTALWCQTAFAGQWVEDPSRPANENGRTNWWYQRDDGTYPAGGWEWLDGNGDGTAESYRFDENGWMYASTTVDGYAVNENGAWVENGAVMTKQVSGQAADTKQAAGWHDDEYGRRYFDSKGNYVTGWKRISGARYYFFEDGYMASGLQSVDGGEYYFYSDGELAEKTVYSESDGVYYVIDKEEHYVIDVVDEEDWPEYRREADREYVEISDISDEEKNDVSGIRYPDQESALESGINHDLAMECFDLINEERIKRGIEPLEYRDEIQEAVDIRAEEIVEKFSHTRPDGSSCFTVFDEVGVDGRAMGENIAAGQRTPAAAVNSWMNSSGHKANILNEQFTEGAIGCYYDPDSSYGYHWVQLFNRS